MSEETDIKNNEDKSEYKKYYDILEIKPDASFLEVKSAYLHLKKLYSSQPLVLSPIMDEISEEKREDILTQLDHAYETLKEFYASEEKGKITSAKEWVRTHNVPEFEVYSGNALRLTREVLGVELNEIALFTGIPAKHLKNIELERLELLPPQGYIRVFLKKYAEYLSLDSERIIRDYLKLVEKKKKGARGKG